MLIIKKRVDGWMKEKHFPLVLFTLWWQQYWSTSQPLPFTSFTIFSLLFRIDAFAVKKNKRKIKQNGIFYQMKITTLDHSMWTHMVDDKNGFSILFFQQPSIPCFFPSYKGSSIIKKKLIGDNQQIAINSLFHQHNFFISLVSHLYVLWVMFSDVEIVNNKESFFMIYFFPNRFDFYFCK